MTHLRTFLILTLLFARSPGYLIGQQDTTAVQDTVKPVGVFTDTTFVDDTTQVQEAHPQDSPEERGFLIVTSDGNAALRIRGSLRVNGAYDFRGLQSADNFNTFEIPVGEANTADPRFFMNANQTRLGLEVTSGTDFGDMFLRVETDFLGASNSLRIRHAYGSLWRLLVGQTWSTFGDVASLPLTVDLDGPNSSVAVRTVQLRYAFQRTGEWRVALAAEAPAPQIARFDSLDVESAFQVTPDIAARIRRVGDWGHIQLAGVGRVINVKDVENNLQVLGGFGALLSGNISLRDRSHVLFQMVGGSAISRFISTLDGQGLDVVFNPESGKFETLGAFGGFVSWGEDWRSNIFSYVTVGLVGIEGKTFAPDDAFRSSQYASATVFWIATDGARLGTEFAWGRRENRDGQDGLASRLSFILYFDF